MDIDSRKRGRPSFIEDEVRLHVRVDGWLDRSIEILMKIDRVKIGKVSKAWYVRNILNEYVRGRQWQIDGVLEAKRQELASREGLTQ